MRAALAALSGCLLVLAPLLAGGSCGSECPPATDLPAPMTEARAKAIAPDVSTGLAVSTTRLRGDCRPKSGPAVPPEDLCAASVDPDCLRERAPLRVFAVPVNVSVPIAERCGGGFAVADLASVAVDERRASAGGELVLALDASTYRVYLSADDLCARCGAASEAADAGCTVLVPTGRVAARDLVLDEATH